MDHIAGFSSDLERVGTGDGFFERLTYKLLVTVIAGSSLAVLAAFAGGSLHEIGRAVGSVLDTASARTGLIVQHIDTPGVTGKDRDHILKAIQLIPGKTPTYRVNPSQIYQKLEVVDSIGRARVLRNWPDRIMILVEPRKPAALSHRAGEWAVIDRSGHVVPNAQAQDHVSLPKLSGLKNGESIDEILADLKQFPHIAAQLSYATRIHARRWDLVLHSGTRLLLPEDARRHKALRLAAHLHQHTHLLDGTLERVDLRQSKYLIVRKPIKKKNGYSRSKLSPVWPFETPPTKPRDA